MRERDKVGKFEELLDLYKTKPTNLDSQGVFEEVNLKERSPVVKTEAAENNWMNSAHEEDDKLSCMSMESSLFIEGPGKQLVSNSNFNLQPLTQNPKPIQTKDLALKKEIESIVKSSRTGIVSVFLAV